ncbi:hypothetical protein [Actinoplanes sp. NPDC049802]|uniref:hypothetical protein n=1 Tax=Actinoplanes sp. NPDC049802 TaxID=3154742 RepID=UPI0033C1E30C
MTFTPPFLYDLIDQLRRRGLQIGVDDCLDLQRALSAGFGLASGADFRRLCRTLWAKSAAEAEIVEAALARVEAPEWSRPAAGTVRSGSGDETPDGEDSDGSASAVPEKEGLDPDPVGPALLGMPGLVHLPPRTGRHDTSLVLTPQYPLTSREIVQVWRTLRRPLRQGPPAELDVDATLTRRASRGVVTPPVLVPARRNTARLLLLLDRNGSMTPFHDYVDHVRDAMQRAGRLDVVTVGYFHNTVGRSGSRPVLARLPDPFSPALDPVLDDIGTLADGRVYRDPQLTEPIGLATVLAGTTRATSAVIISDAGAARGGLDTPRLLDTIALIKTVRAMAGGLVWLNPVSPSRWTRSNAGQLARHVPMFPLSRTGMYRAVDVLRGRPAPLERPL